MMDAKEIAAATLPLPATEVVGSDRYAVTVVAANRTGRRITVLDRNCVRRDFSLRKDGRYRQMRVPAIRGCYLTVGVAEDHRDPHF